MITYKVTVVDSDDPDELTHWEMKEEDEVFRPIPGIKSSKRASRWESDGELLELDFEKEFELTKEFLDAL